MQLKAIVLYPQLKAIEGYKETEKTQWMDVNLPLMDRLRRETAIAMEGEELEPLNEIHVLDLAADGEIKPHIDSVKVKREAFGTNKSSGGVCEKGLPPPPPPPPPPSPDRISLPVP